MLASFIAKVQRLRRWSVFYACCVYTKGRLQRFSISFTCCVYTRGRLHRLSVCLSVMPAALIYIRSKLQRFVSYARCVDTIGRLRRLGVTEMLAFFCKTSHC